MALIGFARVSTQQQDLTEQEKALTEYGCKKIFSSKHSGKAETNKKALDELFSYIREGDIVVVTKLDRLGRSLSQCLNALELFKQRGIGFIALNQNIDTTKRDDPMAMAIIHLLGLFAELERNFIIERTQSGKQAKIAAGNISARGGRPSALSLKEQKNLVKDLQNGMSLMSASTKYNVSRATISRYKMSIEK